MRQKKRYLNGGIHQMARIEGVLAGELAPQGLRMGRPKVGGFVDKALSEWYYYFDLAGFFVSWQGASEISIGEGKVRCTIPGPFPEGKLILMVKGGGGRQR